jgi:aspartate aminotransferase-like enzyme
VTEGLQYVFQTSGTVLTITGSGTSGMESAIVGCCPPAGRLVAGAGSSAKRWARCARRSALRCEHDVEWGLWSQGRGHSAAAQERFNDRAVIVTHSETSTAAACDLEKIAGVVRERGDDVLLLVDGITSVGALR